MFTFTGSDHSPTDLQRPQSLPVIILIATESAVRTTISKTNTDLSNLKERKLHKRTPMSDAQAMTLLLNCSLGRNVWPCISSLGYERIFVTLQDRSLDRDQSWKKPGNINMTQCPHTSLLKLELNVFEVSSCFCFSFLSISPYLSNHPPIPQVPPNPSPQNVLSGDTLLYTIPWFYHLDLLSNITLSNFGKASDYYTLWQKGNFCFGTYEEINYSLWFLLYPCWI